MSETAQQYTQRILANAPGQDPIKVQSATTKKLDRLIKGVPTAKLRKRPAPDKWSVAEILAIVPTSKSSSDGGCPPSSEPREPPSRPTIKTHGSPPDTTTNAIPENL